MKIVTILTAAAILCLFASCGPKVELTDRPNTAEITARPVTLADGEWTEITIKQTLSFKEPMVVENISDALADSMQFGVQHCSDKYDSRGRHIARTMIIHARSLQRGKEIILTQKDFVFHPSIIGWTPIHITSSKEFPPLQ